MKNRFKIAKEMLKGKLEEAKSDKAQTDEITTGNTISRQKSTREQTGFYFKKPPKYMGLLGILAGLSFFFFLTGELRSILECKNWPTVSGTIISSKVDTIDRMEINTLPNRKGMVSRFVYLPAVAYNYTVKGKKYRSSKVFLWMDAEDYHKPETAQKIVDRYPVGKEVTVYYKPDNIEEAILETKIRFTHIVFPGIGVLFVLLGLWALFGKSKKQEDFYR
jgi:hypothetical protein